MQVSSSTSLMSLSPLDGRYALQMSDLRQYMSEFALIRERIRVEIAWLHVLSQADFAGAPVLSTAVLGTLSSLENGLTVEQAVRVKEIEKITNHDVKAIEYFLAEVLDQQHPTEAVAIKPWIHFACTSEDINNIAYARMLLRARSEVLLPAIRGLMVFFTRLAEESADIPMLARTHGQPATPTTMGKEVANVVYRLNRAIQAFERVSLLGKFNGASGNFNAHQISAPGVDWEQLSSTLVSRLGLDYNSHTTQIEPHDGIAEYCDALARLHTILIDWCRDAWGYISLGYFVQVSNSQEVGSSTMPHKINPIDFENAEGNGGIANAVLRHLSEKLPISRWQRDLTDSTVLRNLGVALGHSLLMIKSLQRGMGKIKPDRECMVEDLDLNWEVLTEAIQTVMRWHGLPNPYERLKSLSRGKRVSKADLAQFIASLELPAEDKERLLALRPSTYIGKAVELARRGWS